MLRFIISGDENAPIKVFRKQTFQKHCTELKSGFLGTQNKNTIYRHIPIHFVQIFPDMRTFSYIS